MNPLNFAIARLLENDYQIYLPISAKSDEFDFIANYAGVLQTIKVLPAYSTNKPVKRLSARKAPVCRLLFGCPPRRHDPSILDVMLVYHRRSLWWIPFEVISEFNTLSLGANWDEYVFYGKPPQPKAGGELTEAARIFAAELKGA